MPTESELTDYYELLQISPNAEPETIHRVYKMLAQRYHPDNPETGDVDRFLLLNQAFETLADPGLRQSYNAIYEDHRARPIDEMLPWDHILVKKGRAYLAKEQGRSLVQLDAMAGAE